jgi:quinol monooxygenase YgiN
MIVIAGTLTLDPADRASLLEAMGPRVASTRADEPGCLAYSFSADPLQADTVLIFEHWLDADSLEAHFVHPNFDAARKVIGGFRVAGSSIRKYRVDASDKIYGPDGKRAAIVTQTQLVLPAAGAE